MSIWRIECTQNGELFDCLMWRQQRGCCPVFVGRGVGPTATVAASRARRGAKIRFSAEPWCRTFAEKLVQEALAQNRGRSWSNL